MIDLKNKTKRLSKQWWRYFVFLSLEDKGPKFEKKWLNAKNGSYLWPNAS